jgi:hypothetical protein
VCSPWRCMAERSKNPVRHMAFSMCHEFCKRRCKVCTAGNADRDSRKTFILQGFFALARGSPGLGGVAGFGCLLLCPRSRIVG